MKSKFYGISLEPEIEIFKNKEKPVIQQRNYSVSDIQLVKTAMPIFTNWTLQNAVTEGYLGNSWVYRCVFLITKNLSAVPWGVKKDGVFVEKHPITQLLSYPNENISAQDFFELLSFWLELTGNAYFLKENNRGKTTAIIPISPDRIKPVPSRTMGEWLDSYILDEMDNPRRFAPEEIIHLKFLNPANPLIGVSPLQVAGKTVDTDTAQKNYNAKASSNHGVVDGVFTFQRDFAGQDDADAIAEKLEEKYRKKRGFLVLGSNAKYDRIALTQQEMDFFDSRKFNRDEICSVFGVPPQLIGSQESMTYDNYFLSQRILWDTTIIPLLDDIADGFNFSFSSELNEGEKIVYDTSNISAVQETQVARADTGKKFWDMGVPFSEINKKLDLGINEYQGWDRNPINTAEQEQRSERYSEKKKPILTLIETRSYDPETEADRRDDYADRFNLPKMTEMLTTQKKKVISDIAATGGKNIKAIIYKDTLENFEPDLRKMYLATGAKFGQNIVVETRESGEAISTAIDEYFKQESTTLIESSYIAETTVTELIALAEEGLAKGWSATQLQEAIIAGTAFSPERSLMLARTITGTAASVGQYQSAKLAGAKVKVWAASMMHTRDEHLQRSGETRKMDERFSPKFGARLGPRYPLDPILKPADRVNCRCSMYFRTK